MFSQLSCAGQNALVLHVRFDNQALSIYRAPHFDQGPVFYRTMLNDIQSEVFWRQHIFGVPQ